MINLRNHLPRDRFGHWIANAYWLAVKVLVGVFIVVVLVEGGFFISVAFMTGQI